MLKVTRTQERDKGLYSCLASNEAGEVRRNFSVEVLGTSQPVFVAHESFPPAGELPGGGPGPRALAVVGGPLRKEGEAKACFLRSSSYSEAIMELSRSSRDYYNPTWKGDNISNTTVP